MISPTIDTVINGELFDWYDKASYGKHYMPLKNRDNGYIEFTKGKDFLDFDFWHSNLTLSDNLEYLVKILAKTHDVKGVTVGKTYITASPASKQMFCDIVSNFAVKENFI